MSHLMPGQFRLTSLSALSNSHQREQRGFIFSPNRFGMRTRPPLRRTMSRHSSRLCFPQRLLLLTAAKFHHDKCWLSSRIVSRQYLRAVWEHFEFSLGAPNGWVKCPAEDVSKVCVFISWPGLFTISTSHFYIFGSISWSLTCGLVAN